MRALLAHTMLCGIYFFTLFNTNFAKIEMFSVIINRLHKIAANALTNDLKLDVI